MRDLEEIVNKMNATHALPMQFIEKVLAAKPLDTEKDATLFSEKGKLNFPFVGSGNTWIDMDMNAVFPKGTYSLAFRHGDFYIRSGNDNLDTGDSSPSALERVRNFFGLEGSEVVSAQEFYVPDSAQYLLVIPKNEYHDLAVLCLEAMSDPKIGSRFLAYTTERGYLSALGAGEGAPAYDIATNLLTLGGLTKSETDAVIRQAATCDNHELATIVRDHVKGVSDSVGKDPNKSSERIRGANDDGTNPPWSFP